MKNIHRSLIFYLSIFLLYTFMPKSIIEGFLTDDLVTAEDNGNQKKYLGVCRLPGENQKVSSCNAGHYISCGGPTSKLT